MVIPLLANQDLTPMLTPRMYSSGSWNLCSHISTGELKYTVDRSFYVTSGGAPETCWRSPRAPGNPSLCTDSTSLLYRRIVELNSNSFLRLQ